MASQDYRDFVHTGPDTLAGRYLRRFWQPVYRSQDLAAGQTMPIRILSQRFTLYRGEGGAAHLVAFRCAHRGAQLSAGWVEGDCVRCLYHGWRYDGSGQCVEQPGEAEDFAAKVRIRSYPVQEYLGLVFAYLGEGEPPAFRRFPDFEQPYVVAVGPAEIWPCNFFNRIDNSTDQAHLSFTHRESLTRLDRQDLLDVRSLEAQETDYGIRLADTLPGREATYQNFVMPNINFIYSPGRVAGSTGDAATLVSYRLAWRVPIDDEHSVSFLVDLTKLTGEAAEEYRQRSQEQFTRSVEELNTNLNRLGEAVLAGRMGIRKIEHTLPPYDEFWVEDYAAQVGQGPIADRSNERLGRMDIGVILLRRIWQRELQALAEERPMKQWTTPAGLI